MRRTAPISALAGTLGLLACSDLPTDPAHTVEPPGEIERPAANTSDSLRVWGMRWFTSDLPPHWVYYWSGGTARRLTVSRTSEPAEVIWEIVDVSGNGICAHTRPVDGSCTGGMLMHGEVPAGTTATVEVDPVLRLTPHPPALEYTLAVVLMDGSEGSFEFTTYRPCTRDSPPLPNYPCQ